MPCGDWMTPAPNDFTSLPVASNLRIGSSVDVRQLFAEQRSATQMLLPSLSMSTALVEPHVRPSSFAHPSTVRYGFGRSLTAGIEALPRGIDERSTCACSVALETRS